MKIPKDLYKFIQKYSSARTASDGYWRSMGSFEDYSENTRNIILSMTPEDFGLSEESDPGPCESLRNLKITYFSPELLKRSLLVSFKSGERLSAQEIVSRVSKVYRDLDFPGIPSVVAVEKLFQIRKIRGSSGNLVYKILSKK